ncbi:MAG TPA: septum formation family protein, partial [Marmoricola sp.]|nr:septum formation family protein [Marmoricola sp.]
MRAALKLIAVAAVVLAVGGCGSTAAKSPTPSTHPSGTPHPISTAPTPGACRDLTFNAAESNSDATPVVPCASPHTSVTVAVGSLIDKQHPTITNLSSPAIQKRLISTCQQDVMRYVEGSNEAYALSLVQAIWFLPTTEQFAAGAHWYRCDLVVLAGQSRLAPLPSRVRGLLARPHALNRWGTCSNTSPSSPKFRLQLCGTSHRWRAVAMMPVPRKASYLSKAVGAEALKNCGKIAAK